MRCPASLAALGQLAHLAGHHGEALAGLAGPGGLDGGVQGQEVGLAGDLFYDIDLVGDLVHGHHGLVDGGSAQLGVTGRLARHALGGLRIVGVLLDGAGHFFD
jgi:hypothetical protein